MREDCINDMNLRSLMTFYFGNKHYSLIGVHDSHALFLEDC